MFRGLLLYGRRDRTILGLSGWFIYDRHGGVRRARKEAGCRSFSVKMIAGSDS
jgi:hypothetical protein